jgi:hypothetical protein
MSVGIVRVPRSGTQFAGVAEAGASRADIRGTHGFLMMLGENDGLKGRATRAGAAGSSP